MFKSNSRKSESLSTSNESAILASWATICDWLGQAGQQKASQTADISFQILFLSLFFSTKIKTNTGKMCVLFSKEGVETNEVRPNWKRRQNRKTWGIGDNKSAGWHRSLFGMVSSARQLFGNPACSVHVALSEVTESAIPRYYDLARDEASKLGYALRRKYFVRPGQAAGPNA